VLEAIAYALEESDGESWPELKDIAESTGRPVEEVWKAAVALRDGQLVELHSAGTKGNWLVSSISGRARQIVGQWPDAEHFAALLVRQLEAEAAAEGSPERQAELRGVANFLGGVGRDIVVDAASIVIAQAMDE
jgi:hypothetical protein